MTFICFIYSSIIPRLYKLTKRCIIKQTLNIFYILLILDSLKLTKVDACLPIHGTLGRRLNISLERFYWKRVQKVDGATFPKLIRIND